MSGTQTPDPSVAANRSLSRVMLAVLAGLFLLPLLVSFWMYFGTGWRPAGHVNHGELISPARPLGDVPLHTGLDGEPLPAQLFRHQWSLVYLGDGQCDPGCRHSLYVMRQTRLALNNDMTRVARVFLVSSGCCAQEFLRREHPGLIVVDATGSAAHALLDAFPVADREQSLFIVDPLGNLMMQYPLRQDPKGLLQDLKKLLALSHIG